MNEPLAAEGYTVGGTLALTPPERSAWQVTSIAPANAPFPSKLGLSGFAADSR